MSYAGHFFSRLPPFELALTLVIAITGLKDLITEIEEVVHLQEEDTVEVAHVHFRHHLAVAHATVKEEAGVEVEAEAEVGAEAGVEVEAESEAEVEAFQEVALLVV